MGFVEEFAKIATPDQIIKNSLIYALSQMLAELTEEQKAMFIKIWPIAIPNMSEAELRNALNLCNRTVAKNRAGRPPPLKCDICGCKLNSGSRCGSCEADEQTQSEIDRDRE